MIDLILIGSACGLVGLGAGLLARRSAVNDLEANVQFWLSESRRAASTIASLRMSAECRTSEIANLEDRIRSMLPLYNLGVRRRDALDKQNAKERADRAAK